MKDGIKSKTSTSTNNNKDIYNELSKRRFLSRFKGKNIDNYIYKPTQINNSGQNEYIQDINVKKTEYISNIMKNFYL
jgi:hypothetical protein